MISITDYAKKFVEENVDLIDKNDWRQFVTLMYTYLSWMDAREVQALFSEAGIDLIAEAKKFLQEDILADACLQFRTDEETKCRFEWFANHYLNNMCGLEYDTVADLIAQNQDNYQVEISYDRGDNEYYIDPCHNFGIFDGV